VDRFVALNHFFAREMGRRMGVRAERIAVIPHGLDLAAFPAEPPDREARRARRGGRLVLGFLARACPEKGLDQAIQAVRLLAAGHDVELQAAGATVEAERTYLEGCLALAEELGVGDRVHWHGQVDRAEKLRLLEAIDLFVIPATHPEAKGLPAIEAMAAGVPVIAPDEGCFPELLDEEQAGLLHLPRSPADLAATVAELADDPLAAAALGRHAHRLARSRHASESMAAAHFELYERVLAGG